MVISTRRREHVTWQSFTQNRPTKLDFISAFISTVEPRDFLNIFEDMKKIEQDYQKRLLSYYYWKEYITEESQSLYLSIIPAEILQKSIEPVIAKPLIDISYVKRNDVDELLGIVGKHVLEKVVKLIQDTVNEENWPLNKVEIHIVKDLEISDLEHVLVTLFFNADFDTANKHIYIFYDRLDTLTDTLSDQEQDILSRLLFFDVKTEHSISIS